MNDTNTIDLLGLAMSAAAAVFCLVAALALAGLIRINKGAKINRALGIFAFGLVCLALAALDRVLEMFGLPNAAQIRDALSAFGFLCLMIGAVYGRGIYKDLLK